MGERSNISVLDFQKKRWDNESKETDIQMIQTHFELGVKFLKYLKYVKEFREIDHWDTNFNRKMKTLNITKKI